MGTGQDVVLTLDKLERLSVRDDVHTGDEEVEDLEHKHEDGVVREDMRREPEYLPGGNEGSEGGK